jgi:hypothetical protein
MRQLIYTPSGRAGEYANHGYAANLFSGCTNGCRYCYVPGRFKTREEFAASVTPAPDVLARLKYDLTERKGIPHPLPEPLFLSFSCDPVPNQNLVNEVTIPALRAIHRSGNHARLLTKNLSVSLIDELIPGDEYGATLTVHIPNAMDDWEPGAADYGKRTFGCQIAHNAGIATWASFEPVIDPRQTLELIELVAPYLSYCKLGHTNHLDDFDWPSPGWRQRVEAIDWADFADKATTLCAKLKLPYYIKNDMRPFLESGVNPDTLNTREEIQNNEQRDRGIEDQGG